MRIKKRIIPLLAVFLTIAISGVTFAANSPSLDGKPTAFGQGAITGYFIWQDKDGLHLSTTTTGTKHVFRGTIHTDGEFVDTFGKSAGADDFFRINRTRDEAAFQFANRGDTSNIDLHVARGTYVTFNLSMDGAGIDPARVYIGEAGWHPGDSRFTFRHEGILAEYSDDRTVIIVSGPYWWYPSAYYYWGPGYDGYWSPPDWGIGPWGGPIGHYHHHW